MGACAAVSNPVRSTLRPWLTSRSPMQPGDAGTWTAWSGPLSRDPLGKERGGRTTVEARRAVLDRVVDDHAWLDVVVSDARLVADLAAGHDVVVMGADKWHQLHRPGILRS